MVYAVAMTMIERFEHALGRPVLWAEREPVKGDESIDSPRPKHKLSDTSRDAPAVSCVWDEQDFPYKASTDYA